ncbi:MAG: hypothetical protein ACRYFS_22715 [Janthinobacterium lividum]
MARLFGEDATKYRFAALGIRIVLAYSHPRKAVDFRRPRRIAVPFMAWFRPTNNIGRI